MSEIEPKSQSRPLPVAALTSPATSSPPLSQLPIYPSQPSSKPYHQQKPILPPIPIQSSPARTPSFSQTISISSLTTDPSQPRQSSSSVPLQGSSNYNFSNTSSSPLSSLPPSSSSSSSSNKRPPSNNGPSGRKPNSSSSSSSSEVEIHDIDAGVIRCICGFIDDDGFTIQCEKCHVWQHAVCVNITDENQVPDVYLCDRCGKLEYDVETARRIQARRIELVKKPSITAQIPELLQSKGSKRKRSTGDDDREIKRSAPSTKPLNDIPTVANETQQPAQISVPRKDSPPAISSLNSSESLTSLDKEAKSSSSTGATTRKGRGKRLFITAHEESQDNDNEPEKKFTLSEMYQSYYVPVRFSRFSNPSVHEYVKSIAKMDSNDLDESTSYLSATEYKSIERPSVTVKLTSDHPKQKFSGFSRYGLFLDSQVSRDRFIIEYVGLIMRPVEYKCDPLNQYRHFGCPKPGVLFHSTLPIVVDARKVGSHARFLRRSCTPNCKVSTVIIDDELVVFAVFPLESLKAGTELTIPWEWDPSHPIRKVLDGTSTLEQLTRDERNFLVHSADMIQQRGSECACNLPPSECPLGKMKKALGNPHRVTRTGAKTRAARNGLLDGPANLLEENDRSLQHLHPDQSEDPPAISFFSKREARKLQNAMALIEKLSDTQTKKRKSESEEPSDNSSADKSETSSNDNSNANESEDIDMEDNGSQLKKLKRDNGSTDESGLKKTTTSDKATQTNSLSILLRRDPTDDASTPTNSLGLTITTSALNNPDLLYPNSKRLLRRYLASTQQLPPAHITESFPSTPVPPSLESNETSQFSNIASKILGRLVPATLPPPVITEPKRRTNSFWQSSQLGINSAIGGSTNISRTGSISQASSSTSGLFSRSSSITNLTNVASGKLPEPKSPATISGSINENNGSFRLTASNGKDVGGESLPKVNGLKISHKVNGNEGKNSTSIPDKPSQDLSSVEIANSTAHTSLSSDSTKKTNDTQQSSKSSNSSSVPPFAKNTSNSSIPSTPYKSSDSTNGSSKSHTKYTQTNGTSSHVSSTQPASNGSSTSVPASNGIKNGTMGPPPLPTPTPLANGTSVANGNGNIGPNSQNAMAGNPKPIKKKLSFADYQKKKSGNTNK